MFSRLILCCIVIPAAEPKPLPAELPSRAESEAELLRLGGPGFKLVRTLHFVVASDAEGETLRSFTSRIEVTYRSVVTFAQKTGIELTAPREKLQILFFDKLEGYQEFGRVNHFPAQEDTPGFYSPTSNRSAFFNFANSKAIAHAREQIKSAKEEIRRSASSGDVMSDNPIRAAEARISREQERINRMVVQHEVAHHVLFALGLHAKGQANPRWLTEGLAMMFETPPGKSGAGIGAINQQRLGDWLALESEKKLIAVADLVGNSELVVASNPNAAEAYAQAWALVHYIQRNKKSELVRYVNTIRQRAQGRVYTHDEECETFKDCFGPIDKRFEESFKKYVKKLPFRPSEAGL